MIRPLAFALIVAFPAVAHASEPVRVVVDAPPDCLTQRDLVAEVRALSPNARIASEDDASGWDARAITVTVGAEPDHFTTLLSVRERDGRETSRTVNNETCNETRRSAALLVSLAIDEYSDADGAGSGESQRWPLPARKEAPARRKWTQGAVGSGGILVTAAYGIRDDGPISVYGARALAAWRFGVTRFGVTGAVHYDAYDSNEVLLSGNGRSSGHAISGRAGGMFGWGAPWNDSVAGFVGEVGAETGDIERTRACTQTSMCTTHRRYVSPYAGGWVVLQLPWKYAVRPVVGFGTVVTPARPDPTIAITGDVGIAWRAW